MKDEDVIYMNKEESIRYIAQVHAGGPVHDIVIVQCETKSDVRHVQSLARAEPKLVDGCDLRGNQRQVLLRKKDL